MADAIEHPAYKIARDFMQLITMLFCFYTANIGSRNQDKIEQVEQKQTQVANKQDDAAKKAEAVKETLDSKIEDDTEARGVQLYSTWKYLDDIATMSGSAKDKHKAEEAKKIYDAHLKKYGTKH